MPRLNLSRPRPLGFDRLEDRITPGLFDGIRNRIENEANQRIAEEQAKQAAASATAAQQAAAVQAGVPAPTDRAANPVVFFLDDKQNVRDQQVAFDSVYTGGPNFTGGVWTALGDVNGDGTSDPILAAGAGAIPVVKVFNGKSGVLFREFAAYETSYKGGVNVTSADVNQDGQADIIVGTDQGGGPRVRIFNGADGANNSLLADFLAIDDDSFRGGVRVAMGDLNGDGVDDLIVSAGFGGGPRIAGFDGAQLGQGKAVKLFKDFFAYEDTVRNGAYVSVGYVDGDKYADLIFGGGPGGSPRVRVVSGATVLEKGGDEALKAPMADYFAGSTDDRGGVRVGTMLGDDKLARIVAVGATGDAFAYDNTGKQIRQLNREVVLNSGLLDDGATRRTASPVTDQLTAVFNAFKGTYAGLFTADVGFSGIDPASGSSPTVTTKSADVRYSIAVTDVRLTYGTTYNTLKTVGGRLAFTGSVTAEVGGKAPIVVAVSGQFAVNPFADRDTPAAAFLSGLGPIGSEPNLTANAGNLTWTPTGLTGTTLSARNVEFSFSGVATPATLGKGASPPAPTIPVDYNARVIAAVKGTYVGTYATSVQINSPFSNAVRSVTATLIVDFATALEPTTNPQAGGRQFRLTGTIRVKVDGKPEQFNSFTGLFLPNAFAGAAPITGKLSFSANGGPTTGGTSVPDLNWTPMALTGTNFTSNGFDFTVRAAATPFTWTKA